MKTFTINISDEAVELLKEINNTGYAEYRDVKFKNLKQFLKSDTHLIHNRTKEWFLTRNTNGTFYLLNELFSYNLIDMDENSWHYTVIITDIGKNVLTQLN